MRKLTILGLVLLFASSLFAQTTVDAKEIIQKLNNGEKVYYKDAVIEGNLHLYDLDNLEHHRGNTSHSYIKNDFVFENCKFQGKVLGYTHDEFENETYAVQFEGKAVFKNCEFKRYTTFKYSTFPENADFSGSEFRREAEFKYTEFEDGANFSNVEFKDDANFKYTKFFGLADFSNTQFENDANFKYTEFRNGVDFETTQFEEEPNFKYTKIKGKKAKNKLYRMLLRNER